MLATIPGYTLCMWAAGAVEISVNPVDQYQCQPLGLRVFGHEMP